VATCFRARARFDNPESSTKGRGADHARVPRVAGAIVDPLVATASARDVESTRGYRPPVCTRKMRARAFESVGARLDSVVHTKRSCCCAIFKNFDFLGS
jgi:hypothetical protein